MLRTIAATALIGLAGAAVPAAAVSPTEMVGHHANWLTANGFYIGKVAVSHAAHKEQISCGTFADSYAAAACPGEVVFHRYAMWPAIVKLSDRYGERGRLTPYQRQDVQLVVHELLHQRGADGYWSRQGEELAAGKTLRWWEEGIVEAVSQDITPHVARSLWGHRTRVWSETTYPSRTKAVRQLSVFATWPGKWRDSEATGWRSRLLMADYPTRARMIETAHSIRADWRAR